MKKLWVAAGLVLLSQASAQAMHIIIDYRQLTYLDAALVAQELDALYGPAAAGKAPLMVDFDARTNTVVLANGPADVQREAAALMDQMETEAAAGAQAVAHRTWAVQATSATQGAAANGAIGGGATELRAGLEKRYGIWMFGEALPEWLVLEIPAGASGAEAMALLRGALTRAEGGYVVEEAEGSEGKVFRVAKAGAKMPAVGYGDDLNKIPLTEEVITQVVPLHGLSAEGLAKDLQPLLSPEAKVVAVAGRNCLILTDSSAKVHRLVEIMQKLDDYNNKRPKMVIEYYQMKRGRAVEAARAVNARYRAATGPGRVATQGGSGTNPATLPAVPQTWTIYADSDERTNVVVLNGPVDEVAAALAMVKKMDEDGGPAATGRGR